MSSAATFGMVAAAIVFVLIILAWCLAHGCCGLGRKKRSRREAAEAEAAKLRTTDPTVERRRGESSRKGKHHQPNSEGGNGGGGALSVPLMHHSGVHGRLLHPDMEYEEEDDEDADSHGHHNVDALLFGTPPPDVPGHRTKFELPKHHRPASRSPPPQHREEPGNMHRASSMFNPLDASQQL